MCSVINLIVLRGSSTAPPILRKPDVCLKTMSSSEADHPLKLARRSIEDQFRSFDDTFESLPADLDPESCANSLKDPLLVTNVKKQLKQADGPWIRGFLDSGGLDVLFDTFKSLVSEEVLHNAIILRYIECIKSLLSHTEALDFLVSRASSTKYVNQLLYGKLSFFVYCY